MKKKILHIAKKRLKPFMPEYEPPFYYKSRLALVLFGLVFCLGLGIYGLFFFEPQGMVMKKHILYFSAFALVAIFILASMITPGTKSFWMTFLAPFLIFPFILFRDAHLSGPLALSAVLLYLIFCLFERKHEKVEDKR